MSKHNAGYIAAIRHYLFSYGRRRAADVYYLLRFIASRPQDAAKLTWRWCLSYLFSLLAPLALVWIVLLYWGEARSFDTSISACTWNTWEDWPVNAVPHHLVFIADPQLVDPHTYPGRPWPLSTLTIKHTDMYLRRTYSRLQTTIDPDTILFLGDLFDGGREWSTSTSKSPDPRYWRYGNLFWNREFKRFHRIFFHEWDATREKRKPQRRIIASLPGNHDLGFATGIQIPVRDRFKAYFGESNRIDVIANHTFISLDTTSLSAMMKEDPDTTKDIWKPAEDFLTDIEGKRAEEIGRFLNHKQEEPEKLSHNVESLPAAAVDTGPLEARALDVPTIPNSYSGLPTILLTHIPLHRVQGTPCGPLRERHPPTPPPPGQTTPVFPDDPNSLRVDRGFGIQYQNVLDEPLTQHIVSKIPGEIPYAFSGDDHDYCEVVHASGIHEVTVKSMSWAMGVRKPGFLLVSLWNEIDEEGRRVHVTNKPTLQTHLCLLPDQLSIFIHYAMLFGFTITLLLFRAVVLASRKQTAPDDAALPHMSTKPRHTRSMRSSSTASSSYPSSEIGVSARGGYRYQVSTNQAPNGDRQAFIPADMDVEDDGGYDEDGSKWKARSELDLRGTRRKNRGWVARVVDAWGSGILNVGVPAVTWYIVLLIKS